MKRWMDGLSTHCWRGLALLALTAVLGACGGGGGGGDSAPSTPVGPLQVGDMGFESVWADGDFQLSMTLDVLQNTTLPAGSAATVTVTRQPAHGKAVVAGNRVTYSSDEGFFGDDSFGFRVEAGGRSGEAVARVGVAATLVLNGVVAPAPKGSYTLRALGTEGMNIQTEPQEAARFRMSVRSKHPTEMVTLTATGSGDQSHVVLASLIGDMGSLVKSRATPFDERNRAALRLDVFSTARYALLKKQGPLPVDSAKLAAAQQALSDFDVINQAPGLRNAIADRGMLPAGMNTLLDLAADAQALADAVALAKAKDFSAGVSRDWTVLPSFSPYPAVSAPIVGPQGGRLKVTDVRVLTWRQQENGEIDNQTQVLDVRSDGSLNRLSYPTNSGHWSQDGASLKMDWVDPWSVAYHGPGRNDYAYASRLDSLPAAGDGGRPMYLLYLQVRPRNCSVMQNTCGTPPPATDLWWTYPILVSVTPEVAN